MITLIFWIATARNQVNPATHGSDYFLDYMIASTIAVTISISKPEKSC
ncbi:MAG: hypothetical protein WCI01_12220 [Chlorobiaceae bacterium]